MTRWLAVVLLVLVLPAAAAAQAWEDYDYENLQFRGIGLEVAGIWPAQMEPALSLGVRADLGLVGPHVRISPAIRYWASRLRQNEVDRLADQLRRICERQDQAGTTCPAFQLGTIERSDLELSADAHYLFDVGTVLSPYLGGGASLHLLNGRGEAIDDTFVEDLLDTLAPGLNLVAGLHLPLTRTLELAAESRFVLVSDVHYASALAVFTWILPAPVENPFASRAPGPRR